MPRKKSKREYGEGSVYQRADGRWVAAVRVDGKKVTRTAKDEKAANALRKQLLKEVEQGLDMQAPAWTVQDYLEYWLNVHGPTVRAITLIGYQNALKRLYGPLGRVKLKELKPDRLQLAYGAMLKQYKPMTIQTSHNVLITALGYAVDWGYLPSNPAAKVTPPKLSKREYAVLSLEEARRLIDAAGDKPIRAMIALAVGTGMRKAEMLALKWSSIDLDAKTLQVSEGAVYVKLEEDERGHIVENDPKTGSGRRSLTLPDFVVEELKAHRTRQKVQYMEAATWADLGLVFTKRDGSHMYGAIPNDMLNIALDKAGLPHMRLHDLRHSLASILLAMGVHPKVVQEILGHSNVSITMNIYSHVMPTMHSAAVEDLNVKFKRGEELG